MSFTAAELEALINDDETNGVDGLFFDDSDEPMSPDEWSEVAWGSGGRLHINGEDYTWKPVKDIGGEGQGDYAAVIFAVDGPDGRRLFRKEGYYSSYEGTDWDGNFAEVEAFERTITDYRAV